MSILSFKSTTNNSFTSKWIFRLKSHYTRKVGKYKDERLFSMVGQNTGPLCTALFTVDCSIFHASANFCILFSPYELDFTHDNASYCGLIFSCIVQGCIVGNTEAYSIVLYSFGIVPILSSIVQCIVLLSKSLYRSPLLPNQHRLCCPQQIRRK